MKYIHHSGIFITVVLFTLCSLYVKVKFQEGMVTHRKLDESNKLMMMNVLGRADGMLVKEKALLGSYGITKSHGTYKWIKRGTEPQVYKMGGDPAVIHGAKNTGFIRSMSSQIDGFGTYMTEIEPGEYLGKRIKLSAYIKTENVARWSGLWMRVDGEDDEGEYIQLSFDNMHNRPIIGTTIWGRYEVVLDVPANSTGIYFGILLDGTGEAMMDGLVLETVGYDVPVTDNGKHFILYPAGEFEAAAAFLEHLFEISNPAYPSKTYDVLVYYLSLVRSGQLEKASKKIAEWSAIIDNEWINPVAYFYAAKISEEDVLDSVIDKNRKCEAFYYIGVQYLIDGDTTTARARFETSISTNATNNYEYDWAKIELDRLNQPTNEKK